MACRRDSAWPWMPPPERSAVTLNFWAILAFVKGSMAMAWSSGVTKYCSRVLPLSSNDCLAAGVMRARARAVLRRPIASKYAVFVSAVVMIEILFGYDEVFHHLCLKLVLRK